MTPARSIQDALLNSAPYWAAEHEIAVRYFGSAKRSAATDKIWVGHQMFKEWTGSGVYGPRSTTVATMIKEVAQEIGDLDGHAVAPHPLKATCDKLGFAADELRHYAQLHDLYLLIETVSPPPSIDELGKLPAGTALTDLRLRHRDDPLGEIAVDLSEGGGLGLYFGIRAAAGSLDQDEPVDREILAVAERTIEDETRHLLGRFHKAQQADLSDKEWGTVSDILHEISHQKLLERNEQFGSVLTAEEVATACAENNRARTTEFLITHLHFLLQDLGIKPDAL